jgi:hypothetical protein
MEGAGQSNQVEHLVEGKHLVEGRHFGEDMLLGVGRHSEVDKPLVEDKHLLAAEVQPVVVHLCLHLDILVHEQLLY